MGHGWLLVCLQIDVSKIRLSIKFEYVRSVVFLYLDTVNCKKKLTNYSKEVNS